VGCMRGRGEGGRRRRDGKAATVDGDWDVVNRCSCAGRNFKFEVAGIGEVCTVSTIRYRWIWRQRHGEDRPSCHFDLPMLHAPIPLPPITSSQLGLLLLALNAHSIIVSPRGLTALYHLSLSACHICTVILGTQAHVTRRYVLSRFSL
jgi:hypothetical protein